MDVSKFRILLVEDEVLVRLDLSLTLEDMGHSVVEAGSADHALQILDRSMVFELLVTDIDMPGARNGLELAFTVCETLPFCHILIISGGQQPEPGEMPTGSGFLVKPFAARDLKGAIHALDAA